METVPKLAAEQNLGFVGQVPTLGSIARTVKRFERGTNSKARAQRRSNSVACGAPFVHKAMMPELLLIGAPLGSSSVRKASNNFAERRQLARELRKSK
jgi:hypothetical protein